MKIAFLCEGYSEFESIAPLLRQLQVYNYEFLKDYCVEPSDNHTGIYRHNYKNIGRIRKEYFDLSKLLVDKYKYDRIFVWFDNENISPVCEYAKAQYNVINSTHRDKIDLLISVERLENWYLSNINILSQMLGIRTDALVVALNGGEDFLSCANVDLLNAPRILRNLKIGTAVEGLPKQKLASKFFSLIDREAAYNSESFTRFMSKVNLVF